VLMEDVELDELELDSLDPLDGLDELTLLDELLEDDEVLEDELLEDDDVLEKLLDELLLELELDELLLDTLDGLLVLIEDVLVEDELVEDVLIELSDDELLLKSSKCKIETRSDVRGPGYCNVPVWKYSTSGSEVSPVVRVSVRITRQMMFLGRVSITDSTLPASVVSM